MVNSRTGAPSSPPSIRRPEAPTEKVPETGLTPGMQARHVGHVEAAAGAPDETRQVLLTGLDHQVRGADRRGRAVRAARRVAGRLRAGLARRARVVEEAEEPPALDQRRAPGGRALAVEGCAARPLRVRPVVGERQRRVGDLVAFAAGEQRAAALHRLGGQHRADEAEEGGGHERVEHHRAAAALRAARAHQGERPLRRLVADGLRIERVRVTAEPDAETGHQVLALARERRGVGPRLGRRVGGGEAARVDERHRALGIRVDRVLDLAHALVRARRALDLERELDLASGLPVGELRGGEAVHVGDAEVLGQARELVLIGNLGGLARGARHLGHALVRQVGAVRVARAQAGERAHADAAAAGVAEALDLAAVDADAAARRLLGPGIGVAGARGQRGLNRLRGGALEAHEPVPPTVSSRRRTCGWPTPAATDCPALPQ